MENPMALEAQPNLRPAEECIWYVLATIAGEPGKSEEPIETMAENRRLWNGLMGLRWPTAAAATVEDAYGDRVSLPELSVDDQLRIRAALQARGFPEGQVPGFGEQIDFSYVDLPPAFAMGGFVFKGIATFEGARFDSAAHVFLGAVFDGNVTFEGAEFRGDFVFMRVKFEHSPTFSRAQFHRRADFRGCTFPSRARFNHAHFSWPALFDDCVFEYGANFMDAVLESDISFRSANFQWIVYFQRAKFRGGVPAFFKAELPEYTVWHDCEWPKIPKSIDIALGHIQGYQRLARMMSDLEKFDDHRMFVREEMRVRRRVERWFPAGLMNHAYELICDYGFGLGRILAIWFCHIVIGAELLFFPKLTATLKVGTVSGWPAAKESILDFLLALVLSFTNAHGPLGLYRTYFQEEIKDWPWLIWVGPVQTVLGVIILFFLLLTIRNRFRMR